MAGILGWKDILRPIRDGYRHIFPAPDTGPSPEERRKTREKDRLKGFTYFDTFEQLITWDTNQSDPLQRANTPLLTRCIDGKTRSENKSKLLVCHDYAGNYHDYESVQSFSLCGEMYSCEYLQCVESFVYFSHKLVCVPPPTWINTLHRNGVKALGTILLEPQTKETETLLRHAGSGFIMADTLARIAKHYGFDGFLVNLEKPFPRDTWSVGILQSFLDQLREALGADGVLIWYDALTISNEVRYQNGVTSANIPFAKACGRILTNYCWDESQAQASKHVAMQADLLLDHVYFGIDVWAQNKNFLGHSRSTYPKQGGGGTNTGIAVAKLAEMGMSAGIFAPAWSFEHFSHHGRGIQRTMWEGEEFPRGTECPCGNDSIRHRATGPPIITNAMLHPAGSETFFYTDFLRAFTGYQDDKEQIHDAHIVHAQLGSQSLLPNSSPTIEQGKTSSITCIVEGPVYGTAKLVIESRESQSVSEDDSEKAVRWLPLYKLDMPANDTLSLTITCRTLFPIVSKANPSFYVKFSNQQEPQLFEIDTSGNQHVIRTNLSTSPASDATARVVELGFHLAGSVGEGTVPVVEATSILIMPHAAHQTPGICSIHSIRLQTHTADENSHTRLCWDYTDNSKSRVPDVPYSNITGPFSHFEVDIDGKRDGRVYAVQHIIRNTVAEAPAAKGMNVEITGVGFDGRVLARQKATLPISTECDV